MKNEQPQSASPDAGDDSKDQLIRQLVAQFPEEESPEEIAAQVLSRVSRQRRTRRAVRTGIGVAAVLGVAFLSLRFVRLDSPRTPIAGIDRTGSEAEADPLPVSIANAHFVSLTATAPVVQFRLLSQDQLAILHCLKSLEEEEL